MANIKTIVEKLSQFNNMSFTIKQWEIILKGCSCPKSCNFWIALRENNLIQVGEFYILIGINSKSFNKIWINYCNSIKAKKTYLKPQKKKEINITLYMVDGYLTTDKPIRE